MKFPAGLKIRNTGVAFLVTLVFLLLAFRAEAGVATLYKGNQPLGQIPAMDGRNGFVISVADAGALLGFSASVAGEELHLSKGGDKLRIVLDAVAAWRNNQLIPLYEASYVQDGRWWLDVPSSLSLLQHYAGRGGADRLRVEETAAPAAAQAPPKANVSAPPPEVKNQPVQQAPAGDRVVVVSEPVKPPPNKTAAAPSSGAAPAAAQVSDTSFSGRPGDVRAIRWSAAKDKIRAVIDCSDGTNPEYKVVSGKVSLTFAHVPDDVQGIPSPYENVKAETVQNAGGSTAILFSAAGVRVVPLLLDAPRRVVLDFIFNTPTVVREMPGPAAVAPAAAAKVSPNAPKKNGKLLVVLDPGHGGNDSGAVGNGFKEKDINLAIGLKMEKILLSKGFDVKMTRKTDVYLKLQERTDFANKNKADMFVSVHVNALPPGKNSAGFEIYLMALPTDKDALALAKIENREYMEDKTGGGATDARTELLLRILGDMQQNNKIDESTLVAEVLFKAGNRNGLPMKRVAQAPFFVLRGAAMPAVLLETGFITNASEAKLLANAGYQQKIAETMADGIYNYLKQ